MSAFLGRITHGVELLGGRAVDADARRVLRERRLELGHLRLDALDVLLGALDVVVLLGDAAGAARGASSSEPAVTVLRPRKPPRIEPATDTAVCRPAPRCWFSSRSTACCAVCSFCWSAATLVVVLRAQLLALRVAALARALREPRAEVGLRLAGARDELLRRAAPERHVCVW